MQKKPSLKFPKSFLWGAATSAHQVEGGNTNQWSVWEKENAKSLATQAVYQYGDLEHWDDIKKLATLPANYISGKAVDHYNRYEEDFDLLEKMNMNAFRFGVEWSRIEPQEGTWNAEAITHYKNYVTELKRRNIEPVVTLFHFTLPLWFDTLGGFEKKGNIKYFTRFAEKIVRELGPQVKYIVTINEPNVYAGQSYHEGLWPPQVQNKRALRRVLKNLAKAHNVAEKAIKQVNRRAKVSVAYNSTYIYPGDDAWLSQLAAHIIQYGADDYFLKKVIKRCDFLGVNFYFSNRIYGYRVHNPNAITSDLGWDVSPENIEHALVRLYDKYKKPLFVLENGIADATDSTRKVWLVKTINGMNSALKSGVQMIGYLHWSLTDNFEWADGRWPRFGLAEVDYRTYRRTLRPSAVWFGKVIKKLRGI